MLSFNLDGQWTVFRPLKRKEYHKMPFMKPRFLILFTLILLSIGSSLVAQPETDCDLAVVLEHQQEHAARIADLEHAVHDDLDAALETLYITGIAYQALAVDCGFNRVAEAAAVHDAEHETHSAEDNHDHAAIEDAAHAIGDPENGEVLFNTMKAEVGFACATCHRVDTTERLIGPGLLGIGNPEHDPSEHDMNAMDTEKDDGHTAGGHGETETEGESNGESTGHTTHTETPSDDSDMAGNDPVEYIRTSILHPSEFLVPGYPDNLMPKTYGEIYTEDEINDLVAYLMTLQ
jgi:mono/diheme cytochrome c family protein